MGCGVMLTYVETKEQLKTRPTNSVFKIVNTKIPAAQQMPVANKNDNANQMKQQLKAPQLEVSGEVHVNVPASIQTVQKKQTLPDNNGKGNIGATVSSKVKQPVVAAKQPQKSNLPKQASNLVNGQTMKKDQKVIQASKSPDVKKQNNVTGPKGKESINANANKKQQKSKGPQQKSPSQIQAANIKVEQPTKSTQPSQPVQIQPTQSSKISPPTQLTQPSKSSQTTQPPQSTELSKPPQSVQSTQPSKISQPPPKAQIKPPERVTPQSQIANKNPRQSQKRQSNKNMIPVESLFLDSAVIGKGQTKQNKPQQKKMVNAPKQEAVKRQSKNEGLKQNLNATRPVSKQGGVKDGSGQGKNKNSIKINQNGSEDPPLQQAIDTKTVNKDVPIASKQGPPAKVTAKKEESKPVPKPSAAKKAETEKNRQKQMQEMEMKVEEAKKKLMENEKVKISVQSKKLKEIYNL